MSNSSTQPVRDTVYTRRSTRAFLDKQVPHAELRALLEDAVHAPSGGNLQPWRMHVVTGAARDRLVETVTTAIAANPMGEPTELSIYPPKLPDPYRTRRYELGEAMYDILGIPREDKAGRIGQLMENYKLFGAPAGIFFSLDRMFDKGQWAHLGMLMQTIALLAEERGLATCMQEAWAARAGVVSKFLGLPDNMQLYCGMAIGYADEAAEINTLRADRAPLDEVADFLTE